MARKYSGILRTRCNCSIFKTLVYSKPWHIQNAEIFRTEVYSEPWDTQNLTKIQKPSKHLQWSVAQKLLTVIVVFSN